MADEQVIYLSPEEELTNVRERLERIPSRRIIFVVPAQTQLRSHVSWRLLHVRARELNKDVLIISTDRQIRSVVKAAGFKVADSLESTPTSKPRPTSRAGRPGLGGKTSARLRTPTGKVSPERQAREQRVPPPVAPPIEPEADDKVSQRDDETVTQKPTQPAATYETDKRQFGPEFEYHVGPPPASLRPLNEAVEDDEPNHEYEDFRQSQSIRQAAQQRDTDTKISPFEQPADTNTRPPIHDLSPGHLDAGDPFTYLDDDQAVQLPEQYGSAFMDEMDEQVPDIATYPTDVLQIEDQGDMGDIVDRSAGSPPTRVVPTANEEQDRPGPPRVHGVRPRTNRGGKILPPLPPATPPDSEDDMVELPPVYEQHPDTTFTPPAARQRGGQRGATTAAGAGADVSGPVELQLPRSQAKAPQAPLKRRPASSSARSARRVSKPPTTAKSPRQGSGGISRFVIPALAVLALLIAVAFLFLVPTADVTVTLPSQSYTLPMKLTATTVSRQDTAQHTLPAQTLIYDTSVQGTGKATGVTTVGTVPADGTVYFTNNGKEQVDIPTGTTIATKTNILFTTQADVLVQPGQTLPTNILAQSPGTSGNVPLNSITVIPTQSISKLQQANPGVTINLSVNNTDPTAHGGAGKASTVTNVDVNSVKKTLDVQVDALIKSYLQKNVHKGDEQGKVIRLETPIVNPTVGSVASNGTFMETLKVHMTVLVVRAADLQVAAAAQMKDTLSKRSSGLALVPQQTLELKQLKNTPAKDGNSLALSFTAVGQVAPQITEDTVRNLMTGKSVDYAQSVLNGKNGTPNVVRTQITVNPDIHWMPFIAQHITVHFKTVPVTTPTPAPPKNGKH
ncbi:MAG: baseplate J/gp47 family protein [Ktedonobacteraceae bacterium]